MRQEKCPVPVHLQPSLRWSFWSSVKVSKIQRGVFPNLPGTEENWGLRVGDQPRNTQQRHLRIPILDEITLSPSQILDPVYRLKGYIFT